MDIKFTSTHKNIYHLIIYKIHTHYLIIFFYNFFQPMSSTINTLASLLHTVICASLDPARKEMREACFDYLSLGGVFFQMDQ